MNSCAVEQLPLINFTPLLDINSNRLILLSCHVPAATQITNAVSDPVAALHGISAFFLTGHSQPHQTKESCLETFCQ